MDVFEIAAANLNLAVIAAMAAMFLLGYLMGRAHHRKDPARIGSRRRWNIGADNTVPRARRHERGGPGYDAEAVARSLPGAARHHLERDELDEAVNAVRAAHPAISAATARRALKIHAQANGL